MISNLIILFYATTSSNYRFDKFDNQQAQFYRLDFPLRLFCRMGTLGIWKLVLFAFWPWYKWLATKYKIDNLTIKILMFWNAKGIVKSDICSYYIHIYALLWYSGAVLYILAHWFITESGEKVDGTAWLWANESWAAAIPISMHRTGWLAWRICHNTAQFRLQ